MQQEIHPTTTERDLVERRPWFTKGEYVKSLALSQLPPGLTDRQSLVRGGIAAWYASGGARTLRPC